jgi:hypothetical protein
MTVLSADSALYVALKLVPEGTTMTVHTRAKGNARTNVVAELRKEPGGGWDDWQILRRPVTADRSLLPETWPTEHPAIVSSQDLAKTLESNTDLWANIDD